MDREHSQIRTDNSVEKNRLLVEKNLHEIYEKEKCFSPIPSLSLHCTNINSVFGISPNLDIKKLWDENK